MSLYIVFDDVSEAQCYSFHLSNKQKEYDFDIYILHFKFTEEEKALYINTLNIVSGKLSHCLYHRRRKVYIKEGEKVYIIVREKVYIKEREKVYIKEREKVYIKKREKVYIIVREKVYIKEREKVYIIVREKVYIKEREKVYIIVREKVYIIVREKVYIIVREKVYIIEEKNYIIKTQHFLPKIKKNLEGNEWFN